MYKYILIITFLLYVFIPVNAYNVKVYYNAAGSENSCRESAACEQWCKNWMGNNSNNLLGWACEKFSGNFGRTCTCFYNKEVSDETFYDRRDERTCKSCKK